MGLNILQIRVGSEGDRIGSVRGKIEGWPPRRWLGLLRCTELLWGEGKERREELMGSGAADEGEM